jgi:cytochrome d ubiquinol oxidase subunit II
MPVFWFTMVAVMLAVYVMLDGFDLGTGVLHRIVARTDAERRVVLRAIGPVWDGNEVWLLAAGGTLFFAFPRLYATSFSGLYLPLIMVLWLLMARGLAIELRNHIAHPLWATLWDVLFAGSSLLLTIFFGAALGNVVRGVSIDGRGAFFAPLWTNPLSLDAPSGILDWYTVLVGVTASLALTHQGALWLVMKTQAVVEERARRAAKLLWTPLAAATVLLTAVTFGVQPLMREHLAARPVGFALPVLILAGLAGSRLLAARRADARAFLASCLFLLGMLTSTAFGLFPYVLPSNVDPAFGLTVWNAAAPEHGLRVGLFWWIPGMALVAAYFVFSYRHFAGKVTMDEGGHGGY